MPAKLDEHEIAARDATDRDAMTRVVNERLVAWQAHERNWVSVRDDLVGALNCATGPHDNLSLPGVVLRAQVKLSDALRLATAAREEYYAARRALHRLRGEDDSE